MWFLSAAADGVDDLHPVVGMEGMVGKGGARHDLAIDLHRQSAPGQAELLDQRGGGGGGVDLAWFAVDENLHRLFTLAVLSVLVYSNTMQRDVIDIKDAVTLDGLFRERVRRSPDSPAYLAWDRRAEQWQQHTWRSMAQQVVRWQHALGREGLAHGDRVALNLRNCPEWVAFDQAALGLGLVTVPLYPDDRPDNVRYILDDAGVRLLFLQDAQQWRRLSEALDDCASLMRVVLLYGEDDDQRVTGLQDWLGEAPDDAEPQGHDAADTLASIVYTSGTTGRPKGVMLSHANLLGNAAASLARLDCFSSDRFLSFLPLSHTLERTGGCYLPMMAGAQVAFARSIPQLADDLVQLAPTVMIAVPRIFERVYGRLQAQLKGRSPLARGLFHLAVATGWRRFERRQGRAGWHPQLLLWPLLDRLVARKVRDRLGGRLRVAVSGGAALSPSVARLFIGLGIELVQGYGLTEASPVVAVNTLQDNLPESVGCPLPGVEVRLGEQDELLVRSPGVMQGYWNNEAATRDTVDAEGWLHTGDQVRIDEQGHIIITGRIKDILVLSSGEKVPPADMETAICLDALIDQALVAGEGKPFLVALLVLNPEEWPAQAEALELDPDDPGSLESPRLHALLIKRANQQLGAFPRYARIRRVAATLEPWTVDDGLLTPTLKTRRNAVLERHAHEMDALFEGLG